MASTSNRFDGLFDLLVVGAGIVGSCAASSAARSGLRVALIDRNDFGGAASANSLKVIHGGLRYLQHLDVVRMRESIRSRSLLLRLAPGLVKPRGFVLPLARSGLKSRPAMSVALAINDLISADRNNALQADHRIPDGHIISDDTFREYFPFIRSSASTGGAVWYDAVAEDTERLTLCFALDAERNGAAIANYVEAAELLRQQNRISGAAVRDTITGEQFEIRARQTMWTGGSALRHVDRAIAESPAAPKNWVRAVNLVLNHSWSSEFGLATEHQADDQANGPAGKKRRRNLFFVPWRGGVMAGTWYVAITGDSETTDVSSREIDSYVTDIRAALPGLDITRRHISMIHSGILPSKAAGSEKPESSTTIRHGPAHHLAEGFTLVQAVKYTTGILVGASASQLAARKIGKQMRKDVWNQPLHGAELPPSDFSPELIHKYMSREHARTLEDVFMRRSGWGTFSVPDQGLMQNVVRCMADKNAWNEQRVASELKNITDMYRARGLASA